MSVTEKMSVAEKNRGVYLEGKMVVTELMYKVRHMPTSTLISKLIHT